MPSGTEIPWWEATAARFSYRNGAPFPKPPVSVTSVDLFPCLQSQLKNEEVTLIYSFFLTCPPSVSLVILKKWRRESFTYNKYLFILSKKHKKNK